MISQNKINKIKAIILDIDGVLTDGKIGYSDGPEEIKFFHVRDGSAIKMALNAGLAVGVLSGRSSMANRRRAEELDLSFTYEGEKDKKAAFGRLLLEQNLVYEECLYIGDDFIDISPLVKSGIGVIVGNAPKELDEFCDFRTEAFGGNGAVREAILWLLKGQNKWNDLIKSYTRELS
jgi:3-deoxy-D-manno-octulosonate 8-phosphate phosphatase (KDO 8-P phosphatase)